MTESFFLRLLTSQILQITLLTVFVAVAVRLCATKRPRLAHLLWLVVVVKCITPPIWSHPYALFGHLQTSKLTSQKAVAKPVIPQMVNDQAGSDIALKTGALSPLIEQANSRTEDSGEIISATSQVTVSTFEPPALSDAELGFQWGWLLLVLCAGTIGSVVFLATKFTRCLYRIRAHRTQEYDDEITLLVGRLCRQLQIRRPPSVIVSDVRFGPAVVGIFRYVVILPKCLVADLSGSEQPHEISRTLSPILAHELLHIRRGDLCVGALQAAVRCLWWFHPAVWIVNRMLSRETERCCDEQVVAELGCSPLEYAQSLLAVIESKHHLKPVPIFPGMKPVEITSHRMERIMSLTQGSRTRMSWRSWIAVLLFAGVVLPGAVMGQADDERSTAGERLLEGMQPDEVASDAVGCGGQEESQTVKYDVRDLVEHLAEAKSLSKGQAWRFLLQDLRQFAGESTARAKVTEQIDPQSGVKTWATIDTPFLWNDGVLTATHDAKGHARVRQRLAQFRKYGFSMVRIKTTIISGPKQLIDALVTDWTVVSTDVSHVAQTINGSVAPLASPTILLGVDRPDKGIQQVGHVTESIQKTRPMFLKLADVDTVSSLIAEAQSHPKCNIQQMRAVSDWNGAEFHIRDCVSRLFVVGYEDRQPQVRELFDGLVMTVRPETQRDGILLNCAVEVNEIGDVETATINRTNQPKLRTMQIPEYHSQRLTAQVKAMPKHTVVMGGLKIGRDDDDATESLLVLLQAQSISGDESAKDTGPQATQGSLTTDSFYNVAEFRRQEWKKMFGKGVNSDAGVTGEIQIDVQKVRVLGAVNRPGVYEMSQGDPWQLLDALAQAGGLTDSEDDRIILRRKAASGTSVRVLSLKASVRDGVQNIRLQGGDVIVVGPEESSSEDPSEDAEARQMEEMGKKLNQLVSWSFQDKSLSDVFGSIATDHDTNVMLDLPFLQKEGRSSEERVTFAVEKLPLTNALSQLCEELDLEWEPQGRTIKITTTKAAAPQLTTRIYQVADLVILRSKDVHQSQPQGEIVPAPVPGPVLDLAIAESGSEGVQPDFSELVELIRTTVEPDSWNGGGNIAPLDDHLSLVIRQTDRVHDQIVDLLNQLRSLQSVQVKTDFHVLKFETPEQLKWLDENIQFHNRPGHHSWALLPMGGRGDQLVQLLDKGTLLSTPSNMTFVGQEANLQISKVNGDQLELMSAAVPTEGDKLLSLTYAASNQSGVPAKQWTQMIGNGQTLLLELTANGNGDPATETSKSLSKRIVMAIRPTIVRQAREQKL